MQINSCGLIYCGMFENRSNKVNDYDDEKRPLKREIKQNEVKQNDIKRKLPSSLSQNESFIGDRFEDTRIPVKKVRKNKKEGK